MTRSYPSIPPNHRGNGCPCNQLRAPRQIVHESSRLERTPHGMMVDRFRFIVSWGGMRQRIRVLLLLARHCPKLHHEANLFRHGTFSLEAVPDHSGDRLPQ